MHVCLVFRWSEGRSSSPVKHSFVEISHENEIIPTAILSLSRIQVQACRAVVSS